jgi:hypothetical protein
MNNPQCRSGPTRIVEGLSAVLMLLGAVLVCLGVGVCLGWITQGWGFPLSPISNWGRVWGIFLLACGICYVAAPIALRIRPREGWHVLTIVCGASVLLGTPIIQSATEMVYNLFRDVPRRPDGVNAVWAFYMILIIALLVALYHGNRRDSD